MRTTIATASLLAVAVLSGACSGGASGGEATTAPAASASPTDVFTPAERWPGLGAGAELDHRTLSPGSVGMAWQIDDAVLLTSTGGLANGHLLGFDLDLDASGRLAAPVLTSGDEGPWMLTADGLVPLEPGAVVGLAGGAAVELGVGDATVLGPDGEARATLDGTVDDLWISATGTVVGNHAGAAWDVEQDAPFEIPADCRVADRHEPGNELVLCDGPDGSTIPGMQLPELTWITWATVGTTGDEFIATATVHGEETLLVGDRVTGEVTTHPGGAIFHRSSGSAWVRTVDGLGELAPDGAITTLRELPGVRAVMIWTR